MRAKLFSFAALFAVAHCAQSDVVFDPVQNKTAVASTDPTQGTATISVTLGTNNATQNLSVLVYQSGTLVAGIPSSAAIDSGAAGVAVTSLLQAPTGANCLTGGTATLANGSYDLYFSVRAVGDANVTYTQATTCGNGFIQSSNLTANFLTMRGTLTVKGDTTYTVTTANAFAGSKHTFDIQAGSPGSSYRCFIVDANVTTFTATSQPLAQYTRTGVGTMDGTAPAVNLLPNGFYKYYCHADVAGGGTTYFDTGDKVATGTLTVNGGNTTTLNNASFSTTL